MADSQQVRAEIVTRLLNDAAFLEQFLQDPDGVLADFPDLDKFDARYLKDKITDWSSLTAVAQRFKIDVPEQIASNVMTVPDETDNPPRLQLALHLQDDPAFFALFQKDAAAALSAYPDLEEDDANYIKERVTDAASLQAVIDRFSTVVQNVDTGEKSIELPEERPSRVINSGFAPETDPAQPIGDHFTPLQTDTAYYFWFEVGEVIAESIAIELYELPVDSLAPETVLQVALFAYEDEFELNPDADLGELRLKSNGDVVVEKAATTAPGVDADLANRRLFFPIRTPKQASYGRFRCNIYYQQTLLQSYQIVARADDAPAPQPYRMMWLWHLDYTLSKFLNGHQLQAMGENVLSIMVNDNGNGTHGFRFLGQKEFKNDATLGEGSITQLQNWTRGALRRAAWGDELPYERSKKYQYGTLNRNKMAADLISMAINGWKAYDALINALAGDVDKAYELQDLMRKPGQVQIATKELAQLVIPAAMFYDRVLLEGNEPEDYSLCSEFLQALEGDAPLEESACFQGNCPSHDAELIICPSGFWGFRHSLGLPMSVKSALDAPLKIGGSSPPKMAVSVSTDPNFKERPSHEQRLQQMGVGWEYADSRDEALTMLKATESQIVYFYCHGGLTKKGSPYLLLGDKNDDWFTRGNLRARQIRWKKIRPLVFINGCHTTQITPERALDFVSGFVETSGAAGVIGTEITIFEPIAVQFAEECLRRFLFDGQTLGEAVRGARLHMLKNGNPLGLVYIPYALPALKLK